MGFTATGPEYQRYQRQQRGRALGFAALAALAVLGILFLVYVPFTIIDPGHRGIVVRLGQVQEKVLPEGFHWYNSLTQSIKEVSVQTETIPFDGNNKSILSAASKDLQEVGISVVVNYHQDPSKVGKIFQQYGETVKGTVLEPIVREAVKSAASQFTAEELVTRRTEYSDKVASALTERFTSKDMVLERVSITNIDFSDSFNKAIEAKVTAEQSAFAAKNKLEQVKFEAQQSVEKAKAQAETIRIQAEAINKQGGADYVRLKAIEQWDGKLPSQMIPGAAVPFIEVGK